MIPNFPPHIQQTLDDAIVEQSRIDWINALKGFLTMKWSDLSSMTILNQTKRDTSAGRSRTHQVLKTPATMTRSLWLGRNDALHQTQETADSLVYTAESAELRRYHSHPELIPSSDQHYCATPLSQLLRSRRSADVGYAGFAQRELIISAMEINKQE